MLRRLFAALLMGLALAPAAHAACPDDAAIVTAIIGLAHSLGFQTIAEGVETQAQLDFLRAHECDEIQGYFYSKPVPADDFARLLAGQVGKKPSTDK